MRLRRPWAIKTALCLTALSALYCNSVKAETSGASEWIQYVQGVATKTSAGSQVHIEDSNNISLVSGDLLVFVSKPSNEAVIKTPHGVVIVKEGNAAIISNRNDILQIANVCGDDDGVKIFLLDSTSDLMKNIQQVDNKELPSNFQKTVKLAAGEKVLLNGKVEFQDRQDVINDENLANVSSFITSISNGYKFTVDGREVSWSEIKSDEGAGNLLSLADFDHRTDKMAFIKPGK